MKSLLFKLLVVIVSVVVLSACGDDSATNNKSTSSQNETSSNENTEQQEEASITVVLSKNKEAEILEEREVEIEEGDILLDVMKENFDVEEEGGFINTLEGLSLDEENKMSWMFSVNGEQSMVGAGEVELKDGDTVNFDYQSWE